MGFLDSFERGLERAVNGAFAKTFRSGLQPVEIAAAIRSELDTRASVVSRDRILVPHRFVVHLSAADYQRMTGLGSDLTDELYRLTRQHAAAQHYSFAGPLAIRFQHDQRVSEGMVRVDADGADEQNVTWQPALEINGQQRPLPNSRATIGRSTDADVTIDDPGASRKHAQVLWNGTRAELRDLGSTNGTRLDGQRISRAPLEPGSVIEIGKTRIVFRVLAQASHADDTTEGGHR